MICEKSNIACEPPTYYQYGAERLALPALGGDGEAVQTEKR